MSQDEAKIANHEEQDDVEAHRKAAAANDEAPAEGDDDVEAHRVRSSKVQKQ